MGKRFFTIWLAIVFLLLGKGEAVSSDYPNNALTYNSSGNHQMKINCTRISEGRISCDFTQLMIRSGPKKQNPQEREKAIKSAMEQFNKKKSTKGCSDLQKMHSALEKFNESGSNLPDVVPGISDQKKFKAKMLDSHPQFIEDTKRQLKALIKVCKKPSLENIVKLNDITFDKISRTCKIWSNQFTHAFEYDGPGRWVSKEGPNGSCGVVFVSTLTKDPKTKVLWNYQTQKIVTNKKGKGYLLKCTDLSEKVQKYTWRSKSTYLGCEYIDYGL